MHLRLLPLGLSLALLGCTTRPPADPCFALLASDHVHQIEKRMPGQPLICMFDYTTPEATYLYLGEDHPTHTVRLGYYRLTTAGQLQMNQDSTALTDQWIDIH